MSLMVKFEHMLFSLSTRFIVLLSYSRVVEPFVDECLSRVVSFTKEEFVGGIIRSPSMVVLLNASDIHSRYNSRFRCATAFLSSRIFGSARCKLALPSLVIYSCTALLLMAVVF